MTKLLLTTIFSCLLMCVFPVQKVEAMESIEISDIDVQRISINLSGNVLIVSGANGQNLQIYNVAGMCLMNIKVDSDEKRYDLNLTRGCYIVKVGRVVRKIFIR